MIPHPPGKRLSLVLFGLLAALSLPSEAIERCPPWLIDGMLRPIAGFPGRLPVPLQRAEGARQLARRIVERANAGSLTPFRLWQDFAESTTTASLAYTPVQLETLAQRLPSRAQELVRNRSHFAEAERWMAELARGGAPVEFLPRALHGLVPRLAGPEYARLRATLAFIDGDRNLAAHLLTRLGRRAGPLRELGQSWGRLAAPVDAILAEREGGDLRLDQRAFLIAVLRNAITGATAGRDDDAEITAVELDRALLTATAGRLQFIHHRLDDVERLRSPRARESATRLHDAPIRVLAPTAEAIVGLPSVGRWADLGDRAETGARSRRSRMAEQATARSLSDGGWALVGIGDVAVKALLWMSEGAWVADFLAWHPHEGRFLIAETKSHDSLTEEAAGHAIEQLHGTLRALRLRLSSPRLDADLELAIRADALPLLRGDFRTGPHPLGRDSEGNFVYRRTAESTEEGPPRYLPLSRRAGQDARYFRLEERLDNVRVEYLCRWRDDGHAEAVFVEGTPIQIRVIPRAR